MSAGVPSSAFRVDYDEAVRFIFRDPQWRRKVLPGILLSMFGFLIIPGLFASGYLLTLAEGIMRAAPEPLPAWQSSGALLRKGWRYFLVAALYQLPSLVLISITLSGLTVFLLSTGLWDFIIGGGTGTPPSIDVRSWIPVFIAGFVLALLAFPLSLIASFLLPAVAAQLVLHNGNWRPALRIRTVIRFIRRNPGQYSLAFVLYLGATNLLSRLGSGVSFTFGQRSDFELKRFLPILLLGIVTSMISAGAVFIVNLCFYQIIGQICRHDQQQTSTPALSEGGS